MSKLANPEEVLREVVWYGAHRYDDKPSQFWNQMRIAAEALRDAEAASTFDDYCENGCPLTREHNMTKLLERIQQLEAYCTDYANDLAILEAENDQLHNILDALRKPSEAVVENACLALYGAHNWAHSDPGDTEWRANARQRFITQLSAAAAAAEQEVERE